MHASGLGERREDRGFWSSGRYWTRLQSVGLGVLLFQKTQKKTHGWIYLFFFKKKERLGSEPSSAFLVGMPCRDAGRQAGGGGAPPHRRGRPSHRSAPPHRCGSRRKDARPSWSGGCARVDGCARMCHARLQMHTTYGNGRKEKRPCLSVRALGALGTHMHVGRQPTPKGNGGKASMRCTSGSVRRRDGSG